MASIVIVDQFWKDPIVAAQLAKNGHNLHVVKSFQECLDFQQEHPADLIILSLPILWGELMPIEQFFSELRQLTAVPVLGLGMKYQAGMRDQTGPRGIEPDDYLRDGLFEAVLTLPLDLNQWTELIKKHTKS